MTITINERPSLAVAAEIRAQLGRQGISQAELARRIGHNNAWLSVRISPKATVDITVDELAEMADALGVDAEDIVVTALRASRGDSKPRRYPFGGRGVNGLSVVNHRLTTDRRTRDAWMLAA